ncbi:MAG: hypothetical protein U9O41_08095 [Candidatus Aerophobetes bacterium]|nr:hypothetical protein [Candidatus Aerophobetes bacterium]
MKVRITQKGTQKLKIIGRMKLAQLLSLPEDRFEAYISKIENSPLFKQLKQKYRLVNYRRFCDVSTKHFSGFREELPTQQRSFEVEELLDENPQTLVILKKIGETIDREEFSKFLQGQKMGIKEIVEKCNLSSEETRIFKNFIDKFQLKQIIDEPSLNYLPFLSSENRTFRIASIEKTEDDLIICSLSDENYLCKGKYSINYDRFEELVKGKRFTLSQINEISRLFKKLDLINRRTTTIYQVLYHLKEIQRPFFESGNPEDLFPLTQSELARRINVHPSTISRVIFNKSVFTPQGKEKLLKFFFSQERVENFLRKIFNEEKGKIKKGILLKSLNDEMIQEKLNAEYGIEISRRTVCKYRQKMKVPSSYKRYYKKD